MQINPKRLNTLEIRIDGLGVKCQWMSNDEDKTISPWIVEWFDDIIHHAIETANPATLIQIVRQ